MIGSIISAVGNIIDDVWTSDEEKDKAEIELKKLEVEEKKIEASLLRGQQEINKVEAKHRSVFIAGWRPMVGWVCATALAWHFLLQPITIFILAQLEINQKLPSFDMGSLMTILMGMLGLGGLRTYEKRKGLTK